MHDNSALAEARIRRAYADRILPGRYRAGAEVEVAGWPVPGEPVPFAEIADKPFRPVEPGQPWGPPWGTLWLRITGTVPAGWPADAVRELAVDLGFGGSTPGFQAEGLAFDAAGTVIKALQPRNGYVPVAAAPGEQFTVYLEAAANPDIGGNWTFQPTPLGDPATAGDQPLYRLGGIRLGLLDEEVCALERDVWVLTGLLAELPADSARRARILRALEQAVDRLDPDAVNATAAEARAALKPALAAPASASAHHVVAVGHAHIDSAWLWPVRETVRKVARTFANVLELMDRYPDFRFVASSAQQYQWIRDHYPELFERVRARVAEGRFTPVGGMWVEADTNLPGGEAMVRQFVAGKGFFLREFGVEPVEVWLPDSFGYSAAMPQIVTAAGCRYFLTQKTSWTDTNRMPHHSFQWEGIDGTRVFTHFPPVDTYGSDLSAADLARAERQHAERGSSDLSLVPYGYGDGGGGPTREMMETARRKADLEGSPTVELGTPVEFFQRAEAELPDAAVWSGELYLEFHRGTYTSQARTKAGNRRSEHLLREAELWATTATVRTGADYPAGQLRAAWETVLLQQFHDILPGSSIAWVHQQAERNYAEVAEELERLIRTALDRLSGSGSGRVAFNAAPFPVAGVPALGAWPVHPAERAAGLHDGRFRLFSAHLTAEFDAEGFLVSLRDRASGRQAIPAGARGNELQFYRDTPNRWDAWDLDASYQRVRIDAVRTDAVRLDGDAVLIERTVGGSPVRQRARLSIDGRSLEIETTVQWRERQKLLKLAFGFDVHADTAASEVQFGHVRRPTHANTSWDAARFETCGHRWVHVAEPGFGVTVANDRVYGRDVTRSTRPGGGTTTLIRESLLRAPLFPDPGADQGEHVFRHSISLGDLLTGVADGYRLNLPLREVTGAAVPPIVSVTPLASTDVPAIVVEAVKLAEDGTGDVIVRLYEACGGRATGRLTPGFPAAAAVRTDLLERPLADQPADPLRLELRAFELVTLRISRG
ncbi:MAG TPA: glycoside hydrolase family 38 C-terminal domain-containing protein [Jatrophihabitans sp.]|nr:glycoside hydrolase family 38 C-terminal domain-containing protein [Jatrophihabitans sp.]